MMPLPVRGRQRHLSDKIHRAISAPQISEGSCHVHRASRALMADLQQELKRIEPPLESVGQLGQVQRAGPCQTLVGHAVLDTEADACQFRWEYRRGGNVDHGARQRDHFPHDLHLDG